MSGYVHFAAGLALGLVPALYIPLRDLVTSTYTYSSQEEPQEVKKLEAFVKKNCRSSSRRSKGVGDGYHIYSLKPPVMVYRHTTQLNKPVVEYTISALRHKDIDNFRKQFELSLSADHVLIHQIDSTTIGWEASVSQRTAKVPPAWDWQTKLTTKIIDLYAEQKQVTVLIDGAPGVGKSKLGRYIYQALQKQQPLLYEGFNMCKPGLSLTRDILGERAGDDTTPIILLINEIDIALAYSHKKHDRMDQMCHAHDKSTFNEFMDVAAETPNLIMICTTNIALDKLEQTYSESIREGRVALKHTQLTRQFDCAVQPGKIANVDPSKT